MVLYNIKNKKMHKELWNN